MFGPGPVRSEIFKIFLVLVRFGPRFLKFFGLGPVRSENFKNVLVLVRSEVSYLLKLHPFKMRNGVKISLFSETASVLDPESGQN